MRLWRNDWGRSSGVAGVQESQNGWTCTENNGLELQPVLLGLITDELDYALFPQLLNSLFTNADSDPDSSPDL